MKTEPIEKEAVRRIVRERYGQIAEQDGGCGCGPSCCAPKSPGETGGTDATAVALGLGYSAEAASAAPMGSNLGLGCGNPQAIAGLKPGETVLDLGSGAGFDAFLAARAVGPSGRVIGVDMTPEMVAKALRNKALGGYDHVEFRVGEIEHLPVDDASVDVVISNCVVNLSPDKGQVFREAFRALKPGGRLAISDIVALGPMPEAARQDWELYTGCVAGASQVGEIKAMLEEAGFEEIRIAHPGESREIVGKWFPGRKPEEMVASASIEGKKPARN